MTEGTLITTTTPGLAFSTGGNGFREDHLGKHRFRLQDGQWYLRVGLGNWAKVSEPARGECLGHGLRPGMVYYGDPNTYRLTWTEYEEVGAITPTFFIVLREGDETTIWELSDELRPAFETAVDQRAFLKDARFINQTWSACEHDRTRDNPARVIYLSDSAFSS